MSTLPADLRSLDKEVQACRKCEIAAIRKVFGHGDPKARVMLVGEGPGAVEDMTGVPFAGPSGDKLNEILQKAGIERNSVWITNVICCVDGRTGVLLPDGKSRRIAQMVHEKYDGKVRSVTPTGEFVDRKVVGWYRTPIAGRRLYRIRFAHGKRNFRGYAGTTLTEDHELLTKRGWVAVRQLHASDLIATGEPFPGPRTMDMILGTVLGDAHISRHSTLALGHCPEQAKWLRLKAQMLSPFGGRETSGPRWIHYSTRAGAFWRWLRNKFYPNGKKVIARELISQMGLLGLATLLMDDGNVRIQGNRSPQAEIATTDFTKEDVEWFVHRLNQQGFKCWSRYGSGWRIAFGAEGTQTLCRKVARFIPPSMRYKLPAPFRAIPFDKREYKPEPPEMFWDTFEREAVEPKSKGMPGKDYRVKSVYCLDVDGTHNFITPGGVVHNCRTGEDNRDPRPDEIKNCWGFFYQQVKLVDPEVIVALGKVAAQVVLHRKLTGMKELRGTVQPVFIDRPRKVIVTWHPSYCLRIGSPQLDIIVQRDLELARDESAKSCREESK